MFYKYLTIKHLRSGTLVAKLSLSGLNVILPSRNRNYPVSVHPARVN